MALLGCGMLLPWWASRAPDITIAVLVAMMLPALAIALHALVLRARLRTLAGGFSRAMPAGPAALDTSPLAFDIGIGAVVRLLKLDNATHPYRSGHNPGIAAACHGDAATARSDVRLLVVGSALVVAAGALHIAALFALR